MINSQQLREKLLQTDDEFRQLAEQHQDLDIRLTELVRHPHPSGADEIEKATLKKRKLQLKDRMEHILRRRRMPARDGGTAALETQARS